MGRKNKRGDRGSTEDQDDTTTAKRPNMDETSKPRGYEQINLIDMHVILLDIQATVQNMSKEHSKLLMEVAELKASFGRHETQFDNMKKTLDTVVKGNEQLTKELRAAKEKINQQYDEIEELHDSIDALEQYSRKNSLEIVGTPEDLRENEEVALKLEASG